MLNMYPNALEKRGGLQKILVLYVFCTFLVLALSTLTLPWIPGDVSLTLGRPTLVQGSLRLWRWVGSVYQSQLLVASLAWLLLGWAILSFRTRWEGLLLGLSLLFCGLLICRPMGEIPFQTAAIPGILAILLRLDSKKKRLLLLLLYGILLLLGMGILQGTNPYGVWLWSAQWGVVLGAALGMFWRGRARFLGPGIFAALFLLGGVGLLNLLGTGDSYTPGVIAKGSAILPLFLQGLFLFLGTLTAFQPLRAEWALGILLLLCLSTGFLWSSGESLFFGTFLYLLRPLTPLLFGLSLSLLPGRSSETGEGDTFC